MIRTKSQNVVKEICSHELVEYGREHHRKNRGLDQFCHGPISKYWGNSHSCITRHYPLWAGSRSRTALYISTLQRRISARSLFGLLTPLSLQWYCVMLYRVIYRDSMGFFPDSSHAPAEMHARIDNSRFPLKLWQRKRSRHSGRMRNPQFYASSKKSMVIHVFCCLLYSDTNV